MPQHKRGPWSQTEDNYLLHLVNLHGAHNWVRISSTIGSRSPKQCRERFHQNLKPNLNHDPITPEEGLMIEQMVAEMGKRWAEIARRLRGRSDNAVKNWWNGGMNRRRRSHNHRRHELEVRQQSQRPAPPMASIPLAHPQTMPPHFSQPTQMPQHYYSHPMYHQAHTYMPQQISVPSNGPPFRQPAMIETPLPSPSAFSQMSADGAPSLISDCSSTSNRSPNHGASPIELPPLSGTRSERRNSMAPLLRLGEPGSFASEGEYPIPLMQVPRFEEVHKQPPQVLQEPFVPSQAPAFAHPGHYYQAQQPFQPSPLHSQPVHTFPPPVWAQQHQQLPPTPASAVQLPSISNLAATTADRRTKTPNLLIDPALMPSRSTPVPSAHTPDGSPKDKMSLSNITH